LPAKIKNLPGIVLKLPLTTYYVPSNAKKQQHFAINIVFLLKVDYIGVLFYGQISCRICFQDIQ